MSRPRRLGPTLRKSTSPVVGRIPGERHASPDDRPLESTSVFHCGLVCNLAAGFTSAQRSSHRLWIPSTPLHLIGSSVFRNTRSHSAPDFPATPESSLPTFALSMLLNTVGGAGQQGPDRGWNRRRAVAEEVVVRAQWPGRPRYRAHARTLERPLGRRPSQAPSTLRRKKLDREGRRLQGPPGGSRRSAACSCAARRRNVFAPRTAARCG